MRGIALKSDGDIDNAIKTYKKVLEIDPEYPEAWYKLGVAFDDQGKKKKALKSYKRAVELKGDFKQAWNNLGTVLHSKGKYEKAIENYQKAIEIDPKYTPAWNNIMVSSYEKRVDRKLKKTLKQKVRDFNNELQEFMKISVLWWYDLIFRNNLLKYQQIH